MATARTGGTGVSAGVATTREIAIDLASGAGERSRGAKGEAAVEGFVTLDGVELYRVPNVGAIAPFLMTLSSESDLWMYVSSVGGLTAGRARPSGALFPYETEDRLHRVYGVTGPITLMRLKAAGGAEVVWEPFAPWVADRAVERNLYRDALGSRVVFEERHRGLGLVFRYAWVATEAFGFVREARLENESSAEVTVEVLDGVLNLMPAGLTTALQQSFSCLVDAYKQAEVDEATGLAVYSLTSQVGDKPEPGEVLTATTVFGVWPGVSHGARRISLDEGAVQAFRRGEEIEGTQRVSGKRGAYLVAARLNVARGGAATWSLVADVEQCHQKVARTAARLARPAELVRAIEAAQQETVAGLRRNIAACDGLQAGRDRATTAHHGLNVLFNNMRGGVPLDHYEVEVADFLRFAGARNRDAAPAAERMAGAMAARVSVDELVRAAVDAGNADVVRLAMEYLPLTFGRRHGDPSRPWNQFEIRVRNADGSRRVGYQGNWRDIFQNWEALGLSYPKLLPQFIAKFLNASTVDGFNPYRVTSDGIEWEVEDPNEPWSHLGYWGDHQIVYLLRLLELAEAHEPGWISGWMGRAVFAYANVPYAIRSYEEICANPKRTIRFDVERDREIAGRVRAMGSDGKLVLDGSGRVVHVTLLEKLLVPLLSKLCAVVPGGGVWLNTQRPEWNDANNALAGWGLSVVTLGYMRRYVALLRGVLARCGVREVGVSAEVAGWMDEVRRVLEDAGRGACGRDEVMRRLGGAFEAYRNAAYEAGFSGTTTVSVAACEKALSAAEAFVTQSLEANRRADGLFHSYNLLSFGMSKSAEVGHLSEMLEGQVSALSSGLLSTEAAAGLVESLFASALYREDVKSFILYPNRELPTFAERNLVPERFVRRGTFLRRLMEAGDGSVVREDAGGVCRWHAEMTSAPAVAAALDRLATEPRWAGEVAAARGEVLAAYEEVFRHAKFTGRSGTMHAYEGLGSVYWHMVGKLLVAVQEVYWQEADGAARGTVMARLAAAYYRVREGLGFRKSAAGYGAVPIEPYSHTPFGGGARQPGMTGQVKEELITRRGELGVRVMDGTIRFDPRLLRRRELLERAGELVVVGQDGAERTVALEAGSVGFTVCQVPVVYQFGGAAAASVSIVRPDGSVVREIGAGLDRATSAAVFARTGAVDRVEVRFPRGALELE